jgi:hypothetical protein
VNANVGIAIHAFVALSVPIGSAVYGCVARINNSALAIWALLWDRIVADPSIHMNAPFSLRNALQKTAIG